MSTAPPGRVACCGHQWAKNLLVFVAVLTAHRFSDAGAWRAASLLFAAFCPAAPAIYVINDPLDVADDQSPSGQGEATIRERHAGTKPRSGAATRGRRRGAAATACESRRRCSSTMLGLSIACGALLKRLLWLDVLVLAALYVLRVIAGAFAIAVPMSPVAARFPALFLFISLATLERYGRIGDEHDGRARWPCLSCDRRAGSAGDWCRHD
ncbi:MAG: hypothetical protein IPH76_18875 [Xanthomonadales bacterium]|nr:hypothetical protein [Xanthomonadales bacterium]